MSFILGVEESGYDWLYSDHDNELWGAVKTVYDPCPKGWKVPDKDVYADFMIGDDHDQEQTEALREAYGWNLTDGTMTSFFLGRLGLMIFRLYKSVYKFVLYSSFIRFMCAKFFSSNSFNS